MIRFTVVIGRMARDEVADAVNWIADHSPAAAVRWLDGLELAIQGLSELPTRCRVAPESDVVATEIRQLLYGRKQYKYRILFAIRGSVVFILHVRHGARDFLLPSDFEDFGDE